MLTPDELELLKWIAFSNRSVAARDFHSVWRCLRRLGHARAIHACGAGLRELCRAVLAEHAPAAPPRLVVAEPVAAEAPPENRLLFSVSKYVFMRTFMRGRTR